MGDENVKGAGGIINSIAKYFKHERSSPSPAEVLKMMEEELGQGISKIFGKNALIGVRNGDLRLTLPKYDSLSFELDSGYRNFDEAVRILQGAILVFIEQEIKTETDPTTKRELIQAKAELLKNPGLFGPTTSKYTNLLHSLAGLKAYVDPSSYDGDEAAQLVITKLGDGKLNYLTYAIIKAGLNAAKARKSFRAAITGMFDTNDKIRNYQKGAGINGRYVLKL